MTPGGRLLLSHAPLLGWGPEKQGPSLRRPQALSPVPSLWPATSTSAPPSPKLSAPHPRQPTAAQRDLCPLVSITLPTNGTPKLTPPKQHYSPINIASPTLAFLSSIPSLLSPSPSNHPIS